MMKKMVGRLSCAVLAASLCMAGAAGCEKEADVVNEGETETEEVTIKWMIFGEKFISSDDVIAEFNKKLGEKLPGTRVEFEIVPIEDYKEKWDMKMATNEEVDLVWIGNDIFNYTEEVKAGNFMALDYLLSTNGKGLLEEIPAEMWEKQKRDGKIYSVPLVGASYRKDYAIVTPKRRMAEYGDEEKIASTNQGKLYSDEECYRVIEEYLENLKAARVLGTGVSCDTFSEIAQKGYEGVYGPDSPFVIRIFDEELKVYNKYELDSYRDYFKVMSEWYQKGYVRSDVEEVLAPGNDNGTKAGNSLFLDEYGESGVVQDPIATEYEAARIPLQTYRYVSFECCRNAVAVPRTTKNPKRAMELLRLLNTDEGKELLRFLCNGSEGRHYVKGENGRVNRVTDKTGKAIYFLSPYAIGNTFLNYESSKNEFGQLRNYNEDAVVSPLMGFELDTRMIVVEMAKVDLVVEEYLDTLERGTSRDWEKTYDEMIAKMKEAGADKVIGEMQKQIQAFCEEEDTNTK